MHHIVIIVIIVIIAMLTFVLFHNITYYTNSLLSRIHANKTFWYDEHFGCHKRDIMYGV